MRFCEPLLSAGRCLRFLCVTARGTRDYIARVIQIDISKCCVVWFGSLEMIAITSFCQEGERVVIANISLNHGHGFHACFGPKDANFEMRPLKEIKLVGQTLVATKANYARR